KNGGRGLVGTRPGPRERRKRHISVAQGRRNQKRSTPTAPEPGEPSPDAIEFMKAMEQYKTDKCRPVPTCAGEFDVVPPLGGSEVWEVLRALGYRKVHAPSELPHFGGPPVSPKG